jgi:hypothetical protein
MSIRMSDPAARLPDLPPLLTEPPPLECKRQKVATDHGATS